MKKQSVVLTGDSGLEDLAVLRQHGSTGLRRFRILQLAEETMVQGGVFDGPAQVTKSLENPGRFGDLDERAIVRFAFSETFAVETLIAALEDVREALLETPPSGNLQEPVEH